MKTNNILDITMPWAQSDFSMCFMFFFVIMFFFMFLFALFFFRRRNSSPGCFSNSWMFPNRKMEWESTNVESAKDILKNRLVKGEITETEYDNLLKKIKS